jgi:hypothetical protein
MGLIGILKTNLFVFNRMHDACQRSVMPEHFNLQTVFSGELEITQIIICQNLHNYLWFVYTEFFSQERLDGQAGQASDNRAV